MIGNVAVIGLGQFGRRVALSLASRGYSVLAVDVDDGRVQDVSEEVERAVCLDSTDEQALLSVGMDACDTAVCAIGRKHVEQSILTTALLHQLGVPRIISRATSALHQRILMMVGAAETINPEEEMGDRVAMRLASPGLLDRIPLDEESSLAELRCPAAFAGKSLIELDLRKRYRLTVVALRRARAPAKTTMLIANPDPSTSLQESDVLIAVGHTEDLDRLGRLV